MNFVHTTPNEFFNSTINYISLLSPPLQFVFHFNLCVPFYVPQILRGPSPHYILICWFYCCSSPFFVYNAFRNNNWMGRAEWERGQQLRLNGSSIYW